MSKIQSEGGGSRQAGGARVFRSPAPEVAKPAPTAGPVASPQTAPAQDKRPLDGGMGRRRANTAALDMPTSQVQSNPAAAREVTRRQSRVAATLTSGLGERFPTLGNTVEEEVPSELLEAEQRFDQGEPLFDREVPPEFEVGADVPQTPDFSRETPKSSQQVEGGLTREVFERDGVEYTRETGPDGYTKINYELNGNRYTHKSGEGFASVSIFTGDWDTGFHARTVRLDGESGEVLTESSNSYGGPNPQSREVIVESDGRRTIREVGPGGLEKLERTEYPDSSEETRSYRNGQNSVNQTTSTDPSGGSSTETERNYTTDKTLEQLAAEGTIPPPPKNPPLDVADRLPAEGRGPTSVNTVVVETRAPGASESVIQSARETYSQTSDRVDSNTGNDYDVSITHSVTTVSARGENGDMVVSNVIGGQTLKFSNRDTQLSRTDSWDQNGESEISVNGSEIPSSDILVRVEGHEVRPFSLSTSVTVSNISKTHDTWGLDWLSGERERRYINGSIPHVNMSYDQTFVTTLDVNGKATDVNSLENIDEHGNGRTLSTTSVDGMTARTYTDHSNGGKDYQSQTVFDGTNLSIYEEHLAGPGENEFTTRSDTKVGKDEIASSEAIRRVFNDEADFLQHVGQDKLTSEQLDLIRKGGFPYTVETLSKSSLEQKDKDGNIVQPAENFESFRITSAGGYEVSEHTLNGETLSHTTDPNGEPPIQGMLTTPEGERIPLAINEGGELIFGGETVGQFEFGDDTLASVLKAGQTAGDLLGVAGSAAQGIAEHIRTSSGGHYLPGSSGPGLGRFATKVDILNMAWGVGEVIFADDLGDKLTGAARTAGGGVGSLGSPLGHDDRHLGVVDESSEQRFGGNWCRRGSLRHGYRRDSSREGGRGLGRSRWGSRFLWTARLDRRRWAWLGIHLCGLV